MAIRSMCPVDDGRAATLIDRDGVRVAALLHDPRARGRAGAAGRRRRGRRHGAENARLQAELRARLEEVRGSRARVDRGRAGGAQRLERDLHDGAQQRLVALSLELGLLEKERWRSDPAAGRRNSRTCSGRSPGRWRSCATSRAASTRPSCRGHGLAVALESVASPRPGSGRADGRARRTTCRSRSRSPRTTSSARAWRTSAEARAGVGRQRRCPSARRRRSRRGGGRRRRRRRHRAGLGSARARRPGGGARRAAPGLDARAAAAPGCGRRSRAGSDRRGQRSAPRGHRPAARTTRASRSSASARRGRPAAAGAQLLARRRDHRHPDCRRPTPTRGCAPRSRSARNTRRSACSSSPSTSSSGWR